MLKTIRELPLRTHFNIRTGLMIIGLSISLIARQSSHGSMNAGLWMGLILMFGGFVWHFLFIRCPHCSNPFHLRGGIPKHCPECGKFIDKFH